MSEVSMRQTMRRHFLEEHKEGMWQRIEDGLTPGIPDIFCGALLVPPMWIEAKFLDAEKLPKRSTTPIRLGLKLEQKLWIEAAQRAGLRAVVVAKIGRNEWFVFRDSLKLVVEGVPLEELRALATVYWSGHFEFERVLRAFRA